MRRTETFGFQGIATILVLTSKGTWNIVTIESGVLITDLVVVA